jgi:hypothetical protein
MDWIEGAFRITPDGGTGVTEWLLAAGAAGAVAVVLAVLRSSPARRVLARVMRKP